MMPLYLSLQLEGRIDSSLEERILTKGCANVCVYTRFSVLQFAIRTLQMVVVLYSRKGSANSCSPNIFNSKTLVFAEWS